MSDFYQTGAVATLHRLGYPNVSRLEAELERFSEETPIALVLPCHVRELGTKALKLIVRELKGVSDFEESNLRPWTDDYSDILGPFLAKRKG